MGRLGSLNCFEPHRCRRGRSFSSLLLTKPGGRLKRAISELRETTLLDCREHWHEFQCFCFVALPSRLFTCGSVCL